MKLHYCHKEQATIEFSGQCNWCGEKEMTTFTFADYTHPNWEPPRKALTNEEIDIIGFNLNIPYSIRQIARAIECAHGIVEVVNIETLSTPNFKKETNNENS